MAENNENTIDISLISKAPEILEILLQRIGEAECDSLPEIHAKLLALNYTLKQAVVTQDKKIRESAFNMAVDIEDQIFEQLGYLEEKKGVLKEVIDRLDSLTDFILPESPLSNP